VGYTCHTNRNEKKGKRDEEKPAAAVLYGEFQTDSIMAPSFPVPLAMFAFLIS
jgi:hypothetical protein